MPDDLYDLPEPEREQLLSRVRDMTADETDARLLTLASYARPTASQRIEHRLLAEHQVALMAGQRALAAYSAGADVADRPRGADGGPLRAPAGPAGHGGWAGASGDPHVNGFRTAAMRTLDRLSGSVLNAASADRLDGVLRGGDPRGQTARYLAAVGDPGYASAFAKMVRDPSHGHLKFSPGEVQAVREADQARIYAAALETTSTGFPAPLTVDPTIILEGDGALNPVRQLARVRVIGTHDIQLVSSDGVTAEYVPEGQEATDATPGLAGPKVSTHQGRAFVRFSIEASQDDPSLLSELGRLIRDAREVLDAGKFLSGTGANEPYGLLGGDATYSLTATQEVTTAGAAAVAIGDYWSLKAAIPARFIARTTFVANPATLDAAFRLVGGGSTEPPLFANMDRAGALMGRPHAELSTMATGSATGTKLMIGGDFETGYQVVDRIGMNAELIPHLFGTTANLPTGTRGLYVYWRTGGAVVAQNALRYLQVQ